MPIMITLPKSMTAVMLSGMVMTVQMMKSANILFIIGGPFGLDKTVKEKADSILPLSKMTFSHEMAQLFLIEQIYKGISINLNRKYQKD
jgi:23S rRNA (pseudouridine1915-N3)-methyltransferase